MGRPKAYEREDVARKAMELFWEQGFHGSSTKELANQMGINSYSLFAEFESKQGLFEAAMELYEREVVSRHMASIEAPEADLEDLAALFEFFGSSAGGPGAHRGCFLCNIALERAPFDPTSRTFVEGYVQRIENAISTCLTNAADRGVLRAGVSCEDQARFLTASLLGFWVLMRSGVSRDVLSSAARAGRANLDALLAEMTRQ